jgi:hypothetical protein
MSKKKVKEELSRAPTLLMYFCTGNLLAELRHSRAPEDMPEEWRQTIRDLIGALEKFGVLLLAYKN